MFPDLGQKGLEGKGENAAVPEIIALGKVSFCRFPVGLFNKGYDLVAVPLFNIAVARFGAAWCRSIARFISTPKQ